MVPLQGVAATQRTIGDLRPTIAAEIAAIVRRALPSTMSAAERTRQAEAAGRAVASHQITVVQGTDQLRAFDYRGSWGEADGDLHHIIPLQLGGDHTRLIDVSPELHDELHDLIDSIRFDEDTTLAPNSIREADLNFREGAAVLNPDGTITLYRWNGTAMVAVPRRARRGASRRGT